MGKEEQDDMWGPHISDRERAVDRGFGNMIIQWSATGPNHVQNVYNIIFQITEEL